MAAPEIVKKVPVIITIDFETGGLDCQNAACTQIACQAVRLDTWEIMENYVDYIYPYNKKEVAGQKRKVLKKKVEVEEGSLMAYEQVALTYSDIKMDTLYKVGKPMNEVAQNVIEFFKRNTISKGTNSKPMILGQNIQFDLGFLQQMMYYTGNTENFSKVVAGQKDFFGNFQPHYVDTITIAKMLFAEESVDSYKLELIAERLGIELDDAHDAMADVHATTSVAMVAVNRMRHGSSTSNGEEDTDSIMNNREKTRDHFKI